MSTLSSPEPGNCYEVFGYHGVTSVMYGLGGQWLKWLKTPSPPSPDPWLNMMRLSAKALLASSSPLLPLLESTTGVCSPSSLLGTLPSQAMRVCGSAMSRFSSSTPEGGAAGEGSKPTSRLDQIAGSPKAKPQTYGSIQDAQAAMASGKQGTIPFMALTPYVVESTGFDMMVHSAAVAQLLDLHVFHVTASLSPCVPRDRLLMELSLSVSLELCTGAWLWQVVQIICYISDRAYGNAGSLPKWYMALRAQVTTLAVLSMLCTTAYFLAKDVKKVQTLMAAEDARKAELAEMTTAALAPPESALSQFELDTSKPKGKGWW
eukprot:gene17236-23560_t